MRSWWNLHVLSWSWNYNLNINFIYIFIYCNISEYLYIRASCNFFKIFCNILCWYLTFTVTDHIISSEINEYLYYILLLQYFIMKLIKYLFECNEILLRKNEFFNFLLDVAALIRTKAITTWLSGEDPNLTSPPFFSRFFLNLKTQIGKFLQTNSKNWRVAAIFSFLQAMNRI